MAGAFDDGIRGLLADVDGDGDIPNCGKGTSIGAEASYYYSRGVDDPDGCNKAGLVLLALAHAAARPTPAPTPRPTTRPTPRPTTPAPSAAPTAEESDGASALVATAAVAAAAMMVSLFI